MSAQFAGITIRLDRMESKMTCVESNILLLGQQSLRMQDLLLPMPPNASGAYPPNTSATLTVRQLRTLSSNRVNALLDFYGVASVGTLAERRSALASHLGFSLGDG